MMVCAKKTAPALAWQALAAIFLLAYALPARAQMTPVGTWRSFDDTAKQPKAQIVIAESGGVLTGRIEQLLRPGADPKTVCEHCTGAHKNQPMTGLEIIRGVRQADGKPVWDGGTILDPENGKEFRVSLTPIDGGARLQVRGYLGPFWRTQIWERVK